MGDMIGALGAYGLLDDLCGAVCEAKRFISLLAEGLSTPTPCH
jgi:hypothetical protein